MDFGSNVAVSAITGGVTGAIGAATSKINTAITSGMVDPKSAAAASWAVSGTGKFAEATAKAKTNKALMDEDVRERISSLVLIFWFLGGDRRHP